MTFTSVFRFFAVPLAAAGLWAQAPAPSGHWEGTVTTPNQTLRLVLDVAKNDKGAWIGDLDIPDQGANNAALSNIKVEGAAFSFQVGLPGQPVFSGKISDDGKAFTGKAMMTADGFPFEFKRTGEGKVTVPAASTALAKEFEGTWEGTLDAMGQTLRVVVHLAREADGTGKGTLDSPDQNAAGIAISTVTQKDKSLKFEVAVVSGVYEGKLNDAGTEIAGNWTQGMSTLPLTLKKK